MYQIYDMKCNGMTNPVGITDCNPCFSWKLHSDKNGDRQICYVITVKDANGNTVWDSSEQKTDKVFGICYQGIELKAHTTYRWNVKSISSFCEECISEDGYFTVGNIDNDWSASWIEADQLRKKGNECLEMWKIFAGMVGSSPNPEEFLNPAVCMRKDIHISKPVKKAYAYGTAHGVYQLKIDGNTISELLAPGYTVYDKFLEVQQYDITPFIQPGDHTIGIILADGWYTGKIGLPGVGNQYGETNACYLQINVTYEDGSQEVIGTDNTFKWHESAMEYADLIVGERYRQGYLDDDWCLPGYDTSDWTDVTVRDYGTENFRGRQAEPVRIIDTMKPQDILVTPKGELVIDAGANIVGVISVQFEAKADTVLKMTHSEVLDKEGNFLMNILGQNKNQMDVYVCNRAGEVQWKPEFTIHGFRYVKIEGIEREQLLDVDIHIIATDLEKTGEFECSDPRVNQLQENIFRSQQGNMISIPTDCPQRERAGWTGDMQVYTPTACFNADVYSFLRKWLENMRLEQMEDGQIPNIIPTMPSDALVGNSTSEHICSAAWGDACIIIPYVLYKKYGDIQILKENFDMVERWMKYVEKQASTSFVKPVEEYSSEELLYQKYLWNTEFHFGDWLYPSAMKGGMTNPVETAITTKEYIAPAYFAYTSKIMSEICSILGDNEKACYYAELNSNIKKAYAAVYIDDNGRLPFETQGIYVLALAMDLFPAEKKKAGIERLVELIHNNGYCLDTGFSSIAFLLDTLWDNGEKEIAYRILFQDACPSWLYEVNMGATTIWESWAAILPDGTRTNSSYNHFAFGCVGDFIYRKILGLTEIQPGYRRVEIKPDFSCGLNYAKGTYESVYGKISVSWSQEDGKADVEVIVPPSVEGVVVIGEKTYDIESGYYSFKQIDIL